MKVEEIRLPMMEAVEKAEVKLGKGEFCPVSSFWLSADYGELKFYIGNGDGIVIDIKQIEKETKYKNKYTFKNKVPELDIVLKITEYKHIAAIWTGGGWAKCVGNWILFIDGKDCTKCIPKDMRERDMYTYGEYSTWHFSDDGEEWENYTDGLEEEDWIKENIEWLSKLPVDKSEYGDVFKAFQENDFRTGSCGGCI